MVVLRTAYPESIGSRDLVPDMPHGIRLRELQILVEKRKAAIIKERA